MPRFFFHIRDNGVLLEDPDGVVCADAQQAISGARAAMRDFVKETAHVVGAWSVAIEVIDEAGRLWATCSSCDAPEAEGCSPAMRCQ